MAFSISPQVNIYENDATSLSVPFVGGVVGAMAGLSQWGSVSKPIQLTKGFDEYLERLREPTVECLQSFYIAKDFLQYNGAMMFVRAVGPKARNACWQPAGDNVKHDFISISSAPHLNIVDTSSEPNANVELSLNGVIEAKQITDQNGKTTFQIEVPEGKKIVYMKLTKVD
ncbi:hypothetical protein SHAb15599_00026 [Acinetobacter phage SH-Ab 15599]|nr:hypothetical protein SHAb15599_00026 [Acinetobacter phage SH-Ab 15599]